MRDVLARVVKPGEPAFFRGPEWYVTRIWDGERWATTVGWIMRRRADNDPLGQRG